MVGLMYPSDYGYAAGNECVTGTDLKKYNKGCQAKDWIYNSSEYQWDYNANVIWNKLCVSYRCNRVSSGGNYIHRYVVVSRLLSHLSHSHL